LEEKEPVEWTFAGMNSYHSLRGMCSSQISFPESNVPDKGTKLIMYDIGLLSWFTLFPKEDKIDRRSTCLQAYTGWNQEDYGFPRF